MIIYCSSERFIPEDSLKKAELTSETVFSLLKKLNYREIVLCFSEEHPDKRVEGEGILYAFTCNLRKERLIQTIEQLTNHLNTAFGG